MPNGSAYIRCSVRVHVSLASAKTVEIETLTWRSSFAHKDVDNAAASDLMVEVRQSNPNTESVKVFGRHP